jgi:hypothetical protein
MSAIGQKQTLDEVYGVRFTAQSGHAQRRHTCLLSAKSGFHACPFSRCKILTFVPLHNAAWNVIPKRDML